MLVFVYVVISGGFVGVMYECIDWFVVECLLVVVVGMCYYCLFVDWFGVCWGG